MQAIIDDAQKAWKDGKSDEAFNSLIDAIVLLSKGQQQVMQELAGVQSNLSDHARIGGPL